MPRTTSVTLSPHFGEFVARQVDSGRYQNTSEVIREGLRLLETREEKLETLRAALNAGIAEADQGIFASYDLEDMNTRLDAESQQESR